MSTHTRHDRGVGRCVRCGDLSLDLRHDACRDCRRRVRRGVRPLHDAPAGRVRGVPDTGEGSRIRVGPISTSVNTMSHA